MKKIISFAQTLLMIGTSMLTWAVPAYPELIKFRQPNGKEINIYLKGDERVNWAETEDGYSLLYDGNGNLMFATRTPHGNMIPSSFEATNANERTPEMNEMLLTTPKHLRYSKSQINELLNIWNSIDNAKSGSKAMSDVIGEKKFLVILFGFKDQTFTHTQEEFDILFNQVNYSSRANVGSVHDYYYDASGGQFSLSVDIVGPFKGSQNTSYYGDNGSTGYQRFAREAVDSAAKYVDFSNYDNDGDGQMDGLHIIFAGHGEEAGAGASAIWSHKSSISRAPRYNNTTINTYSCSPECSGNSGTTLTAIGVICHELGHVFGAPDFYDTDYESNGQYPGLGQWDIMSSGSWNRSGKSPAQHNPYTKIYIYKWATCDTLDASPRTVRLMPSETSLNDFHRINTSTSGDFFLIENRQLIKWDASLPGSGMLVYHIHPSVRGASVRNNTHPQQIYILANTPLYHFPNDTAASYGSVNSSSTPYPYGSRDSITDFSYPWLRPWSGERNNISIRNISENAVDKTVCFTIGDGSTDLFNFSAEAVSNSQIALDWIRYGNRNILVLMNSENNQFGIPTGVLNYGDTLPGGGKVILSTGRQNLLVNDLQQGHTYYFKAFTYDRNYTYSNGITATATTMDCSTASLPEDFETTEANQLPPCWKGDWTVSQATSDNKALRSPSAQTAQVEWRSVTTAPFSLDSIMGVVLSFKLNFNEQSDDSTRIKVEYCYNPEAAWDSLTTIYYTFGSAEWSTNYLYLSKAGNNSRLRFSILSDGDAQVMIDDIAVEPGCLIHASSDEFGDISPRGYLIVEKDSVVTFSLSPLPGYRLANVVVNGHNTYVEDSTQYNLKATGNQTIRAEYEKLVSIVEAETNTLSVYPNPTSAVITVNTQPNETLRIYNAVGQTVVDTKAQGTTTQIDLSDMPKGIYMVQHNGMSAKIIKH